MASILDCINEEIKIGKTSITIKNRETGKTKGVVKNITKFKDMQPNKQIEYIKQLREYNIWGNKMVDMDKVLVQDGNIVVFRNMRTIDYHKQHGFFDDMEREREEKKNEFYNELSNDIQVINCYC